MGDERKKRRRGEKEARKILKKLRKSAEKTTELPKEEPVRRVYGPAKPDTLPSVSIGPELPEFLKPAVEDTEELLGPELPDNWGTEEDINTSGRSYDQVERILALLNKGEAFLDPYLVLDVPPETATDAVVKKAYWKCSLAVHPDKSTHSEAPKAFQALNQSWKDLKTAEARRSVDDRRALAAQQRQAEIVAKQQQRQDEWSALLHPEKLQRTVQPQGRQAWMTELPELKRKPQVMKQVHQTSFSRKEYADTTPLAAAQWTKTPEQDFKSPQLPSAPSRAKGEVKRRGRSLMERHQKNQQEATKKLSPSRAPGGFHYRPFDREKDLELKRSKDSDLGSLMNGLGSLKDRFS